MGLLRLLGIEKYLKKVKTYVDEKNSEISDKVDNVKHPTPDWSAKYGSTGYIANRTHYVSDNGNTWSSVTVGSEVIGGFVKSKATINNVENYKFFIIKGTKSGDVGPISTLSSATYYVEFNVANPIPSSVTIEIRVLPTSNSIEVVGSNAELFLASNIIPLNVKTLDKGYLPEGLATEEYVDEKVGSIKPPLDGVNMTILKYVCNPYELDVNYDDNHLPEDLKAVIWGEDTFTPAACFTICVRDADYVYPVSIVECNRLVSEGGNLVYDGEIFVLE